MPEPTDCEPDPSLRRLSALAGAVAGRPLDVQWGAVGDRAVTDGHRILLCRNQAADARTSVVVQAALVAAGSLAPTLMAELGRRRRVHSRYLCLEIARALFVLSQELPRRGWNRPQLPRRTGSARASLDYARGRQPVDAPLPEWGTVNPKAVLAAHRRTGGARPSAPRRDLEDDRPQPDPGNAFTSRRRRRGRRRTYRDGAGVPVDLRTRRDVSGGGGDVRVTDRAPGTGPIAKKATTAVRRYPEWDCHAGRMRPDWCSVVEVAASGTVTAAPTFDIGPALAAVRVDHVRVKGQADGDTIDIDAAIRAHLDALAGQTPDDRIYSSQLARRIPIGVFVLVDMSGSLGRGRPGEPPAAAVHRQAAGTLLTAMQRHGDRTAAAAFRSFGRSRVEITPIIGFGTRFDAVARDDLDRLIPSGFTRMGAAIRYAGDRLRDAHTRRRLLVVITDGYPFDHGYEHDYAAQDTSRALDELFALGIGSVCLAMGEVVRAEQLADVFGSAGFLHLHQLSELRTRFPAAMRLALAHVEKHSRTTRPTAAEFARRP